MKQKIIAALTATILLFAGQANAGIVTGRITEIFVSGINNAPFRLGLDTGIPSECNTVIYVDGGSDNYQVFVSALMLAYSQGKLLDINYATQPNGFCRIQEFRVR